MMDDTFVGDYDIGDGWQCECGKVFFFTGRYFEKHWTNEIRFHCSRCQTHYSLHAGVLRVVSPEPELAEAS